MEDTSAPSLSSMAIDIHVAYPTESSRPETNESVIETLSVTEPSHVVVGSLSFTTCCSSARNASLNVHYPLYM